MFIQTTLARFFGLITALLRSLNPSSEAALPGILSAASAPRLWSLKSRLSSLLVFIFPAPAPCVARGQGVTCVTCVTHHTPAHGSSSGSPRDHRATEQRPPALGRLSPLGRLAGLPWPQLARCPHQPRRSWVAAPMAPSAQTRGNNPEQSTRK